MVASLGRGLGGTLSTAIGQTAQLGKAFLGLGAGIAAVAGGSALLGINMNASLETATLQFQTLLGSADAAAAKVKDLFQFAKVTPFETGPIIEASRILQVFGGNVLNSQKNLTAIGDAAAATSAPIEEVATAVARAYAAIQAGKPFGEAAQRLSELAILTPSARNQMEKLTKAGAPAAKVWGVLTDQLGKFNGAMALQAGTWKGLASTLSDTVKMASGQIFKPLFDGAKEVMVSVVELSNSPAWDAIIAHLQGFVAEGTTGLFGVAGGIRALAKNLTASNVDAIFERITDAVHSVSEALGPLKPVIAGVGLAFATMAGSQIPLIGKMIPVLNPVVGLLGGLALATDAGKAGLEGLGRSLLTAGQSFAPVLAAIRQVVPQLSEGLGGALDAIGPGIESLARTLGPKLGDAIVKLGPPLGALVKSLGELAGSILPPLGEALGGVVDVAGDLAPVIGLAAKAIGLLADNIDVVLPAVVALTVAMGASKLGASLQTGKLHAWTTSIDKAGSSAVAAVLDVGPLGLALSALAAGWVKGQSEARRYTEGIRGFKEAISDAGGELPGFKARLEAVFSGDTQVPLQKSMSLWDQAKTHLKDIATFKLSSSINPTVDTTDLERTLVALQVTTDTVAEHLNDSDEAWQSWQDRMTAAGKAAGLSGGDLKKLDKALDEQRREALKAADAADIHSKATGRGGTAAEVAAGKLDKEREALKKLWSSVTDAANAAFDLRQASLDIGSSLEAMLDAQLKSFVVNKDAAASVRDKAAATREASQAEIAYEKSLINQAKAASDAKGAVEGSAEAIAIQRDQYLAMLKFVPDAEKPFVQGLIDTATEALKGFSSGLAALPQITQDTINAATMNIDPSKGTAAGVKIGGAVGAGVVTGVQAWKPPIDSAMSATAKIPTGGFITFKAAGAGAAESFGVGVTGGLVVQQGPIDAAAQGLAPFPDFSAGGAAGASSFVSGFTGKLSGLAGQIRAVAYAMGLTAAGGLNDGIGARSPSKVTAKSGEDFVTGFSAVIVKSTPEVGQIGVDMGDAAGKGLQDGLKYRAGLVGEDLKSFNDAVTEALKEIRGDSSDWFDLMVQDAADATATMQQRLQGFTRAVTLSLAQTRRELADARKAFDVDTVVRSQLTPGDFLGSLNLSVDTALRGRQDAISKDSFDALTNELVANRLGLTSTQLATQDLVNEINKNTSATLLQRETMMAAEQQLGVTSGGLTDSKDWLIVVNGLQDLFTGTQFEAQTLAEQLGGSVRALADVVSEQNAADERARAAIPPTEEESLRAAISALQKPKELQDLRDQLFALQHPEITNNTTNVNVNVTPVPTEVLAPAELAYLVERSTRLALGVV